MMSMWECGMWTTDRERDFFLIYIDEAIRNLGAAARLAESADLPYVLNMVHDALDCAADARDDVVIKGW